MVKETIWGETQKCKLVCALSRDRVRESVWDLFARGRVREGVSERAGERATEERDRSVCVCLCVCVCL